MKIVTHYDTLKVTQDAPDEVISAAYKALARIYHPDMAGADPDAAAKMQNINISYKVLSDPDKRKEHDAWIRQHERRSQPGADRRQASGGAADAKAKSDKAAADVVKWKAWADKTAQDAKEAQSRVDKALGDLAKARVEDRAKWEAWVKKTEQEAKEARQRADQAAEQYAKAMSSAVESAK